MKLYPCVLLLILAAVSIQGCKSKSNAAPPNHAAEHGSTDSKEANDSPAKSGNGNFSDVQREATVVLADDVSEEAASPLDDKSAEVDVLAELRSKQQEIEEKWFALAKRDAEIKKIDSELDSRLGSITKLEERLERLLGIGRAAQDRRSERVSALAELISTMPPQSGAEIMAKMSDIDAQAILLAIAQKNERKAAKVLALMPSERAAQLGQKYISVEKKLPGSEGLIAHDSPGNTSSTNELPSLDPPETLAKPDPDPNNDTSGKDAVPSSVEKSPQP